MLLLFSLQVIIVFTLTIFAPSITIRGVSSSENVLFNINLCNVIDDLIYLLVIFKLKWNMGSIRDKNPDCLKLC